ncbi:MAG: RsmE family RNA methyltransferase, partial [Deltaproteobacteria bacterium]|nr:RsmE family RNA methyltransferase [Deltaproteobacteria bacterium]
MTRHGEIRLLERITLKENYTVEGDAFKNILLWNPRIGEALTVTDASGALFRARLIALKKERAELLVFEGMGAASSGPEVILLQALPEKERMEAIIRKTTELGVDAIVPFKSLKSISLEEREAGQRKAH